MAPREKATNPMATRQEACHSLSRMKGELVCISPHERRIDSPVETPEEPRDLCKQWKGNLRFRPQVQMRTAALAVSEEESWEAPRNSHGDWTFVKPHEWVPEVPVITREEPHVSCHNSKKSGDSLLQVRCSTFTLRHLERNPTFTLEPRKGP